MESLVGKDPAVIAPFLNELFKAFDEAGIEWAVLHGGDELPYYTRRDIDVLFRKDQIRKACKLLKTVTLASGWKCYAKFRFSILRSFWLMLPAGNHDDSSYLQLDFYVGSPLRGINFYRRSPSEVLKRRQQNQNGVWCLDAFDGAAYVVIKEILATGVIERKSRQDEILNCFKKNPEAFGKAIRRFKVSENTAAKIEDLIQKGAWKDFKGIQSEVKHEIFKFRFSDTFTVLRYVYDVVKMALFPFLRLFIVIIGPDGSGKTTIADKVQEQFSYRPFFGFKRIHGNFGSLPRLRDIMKFGAGLVGHKVTFAAEPPPATRHMGMTPPLSRFRSMLYIAYYGIEYALGRIVLRKWRTFSGMVIADRYFCDYYYMRGHMTSPIWWKKIFEAFAPKPDLIFSLERPAADIYRQKPELTEEEIEREQMVIRTYLNGKKNARIIDASHGVDKTVEAVGIEIEKWLLGER